MEEDLTAERAAVASKLRSLRWVSLILGIWNVGLILIGGWFLVSLPPSCPGRDRLPFAVVALVAVVRILYMVGAARAQRATAVTIISHAREGSATVDAMTRHERRMRYKRWLWWTRFGMAITALQFVVAVYLMFIVTKDFSSSEPPKRCFLGRDLEGGGWKQTLMISFLVLLWLVVIIQCSMGSDVLRWRSFYATHDAAWKAHYREVFDHGIREVLCCLGRVKSVLEEDEVYSVARLLGDLVAYRASGTGHLELLAGLALLQKHKKPPISYNQFMEPPEVRLQEAAMFHQFAEAAYTGPLLDFGRNPVLFPCAWLYRQGILTPWTRNRCPVLDGDNWWRGHAVAFLKYANLSPEALRRGRVSQTKCEAAYFIVVLHELRSVVIAVRGTETPEDLITDGLCRECTLSMDDLAGLIKKWQAYLVEHFVETFPNQRGYENSDQLPALMKEKVLYSFPHYGHSGIVESARELFKQIDGQPRDKGDSTSEMFGFLSSLLGPGCECDGYKIRIVGHSLGGAVAALLGIRLCGRYPNLHVYTYGSLPCVDSVIAEACSDFITSIVYNDEFSARLSINSILRLRAAAISALSKDSPVNSLTMSKLVQRVLRARKYNENGDDHRPSSPSVQPGTNSVEDTNHVYRGKHLKYTIKGGVFLCGHAASCMMNTPKCLTSSFVPCDCDAPAVILNSKGTPDEGTCTFATGNAKPDQEQCRDEVSSFDNSDSHIGNEGISAYNSSEFFNYGLYDFSNNFNPAGSESTPYLFPFANQASQTNDTLSPIEVSTGESPEVYLPGLIIHIVQEQRGTSPLWKSWLVNDKNQDYKAFVANRESFMDIVVSANMFLDHLPWRCHYALQRVLEARKHRGQLNDDLFKGEVMV